ncbi:MAG: hypothetical protein DMF07_09830, partial [Verrucomicrobia bacterium]
ANFRRGGSLRPEYFRGADQLFRRLAQLFARQYQVVRSQAITLQNCGSISTDNSLEVCSIAVAAKESIVGRFCETPRRLTQTPYNPIAHVAHRMTATGNHLATDTVALLYRRL